MTIEEELIRQIGYNTDQLARTVANARALHRHWVGRAKDRHQVAVTMAEANYRKALHEADSTYGRAVEQARAQATDMYRRAGFSLAGWDDGCWDAWQPVASRVGAADSARFGQLIEITPTGSEVILPAVAPLFGGRHLIFLADGSTKEAAAGSLESVFLRLLATTLPGCFRLTLLDPSNLLLCSEALAALAGYDPGLVTGGVWRETDEIEAVLAYLVGRARSETRVDDQGAGTIRRVIAALDFPSGFSQQAANDLRALTQVPGALGAQLLMLLDQTAVVPDGFDQGMLEQVATVIRWDGERFVWDDDELRSCRLKLDASPGEALSQKLVAAVGAGAVKALPTKFNLAQTFPPKRAWWQAGITSCIRAPAGVRCGGEVATICLDDLPLSHLLLTGPLDMGRGELLRSILFSCGVIYRPDALRVYLLSLPGGADLRPFATHWLPHAQVIAVDCDRAYALSVLEALDWLTRMAAPKSDLVSGDGKDDRTGDHPVKHLLVLDEFTFLLAGDDEIALRARDLLTRLIEEGDQNGLHVVLAASPSDLPDVAQPIADQCGARIAFVVNPVGSSAGGKADAGLAIFNDTAGIPWGDQLVRVPTIEEADSINLLAQLQTRGEVPSLFAPQAFYAPDAWAEIARSWSFHQLLAARSSPAKFPVKEIAPPTTEMITPALLGERSLLGQTASAAFWPRDGRHLLIISGDGPAATGMLAATCLSLGLHAQREMRSSSDVEKMPRINVVDFTAGNLPVLGRIASALGPLMEVVSDRELPALLARIAELVDRRFDVQYQSVSTDAPKQPDMSPVFLVLAGLHHALAAPRPYEGDAAERFASAERLARIVRLGPSVGVHVIAWCDAMSSFNAVLGAAMLAEFEMRAVTRLSEEDSIALLNAPAAGSLKDNEALLWDRRQGTLQPFRPFRPPEDDWLARVRESVRGRVPE